MSDKLFTRKLSGLGNTLVRATLQDDRVFIEKIFFADFDDVDFTRREAGREADTMRFLAVRRDDAGRAVSNDDFVFDCRVEEGPDRTVLRMDTVAGWTLAEYRARWRNGVRPWPDSFPEETLDLPTYLERVLEIFTETAYALQAIHRARPAILHCDIKPTNIWVLAGQHPVRRMAGIRLIDFGSAFAPESLVPGQSPRALLEQYSHVCGTPGFWTGNVRKVGQAMTALQEALDCRLPDSEVQTRAQVCRRALQALDPADDIYALTVSLFWALTGQTAEGKTQEALRQILDRELAELPYGVRRAVWDFLRGQLAACASADPADCDAGFLRELETLQQIVQRTGLHPESLRLCAQQWVRVWDRRAPAAPRNCIEEAALPYLSSRGGLLDPEALAWVRPDRNGVATLVTCLRKGKSFCIRGPAGMGKTCLLRHTFGQLLESPRTVPLYLPLDRFDPTAPDALLRFVGETYLSYLQEDVPDAPAALRRLFANETQYRFCLFLDHLDPAQCGENSPLYHQIRELCAFACVQVVTAGREAPALGLPVLYTVPHGGALPGNLPSPEKGGWYQRLARFLLCSAALEYLPQKLFCGLTWESQRTVTATQLRILALWDRCRFAPAGTSPAQARQMLLSYFPTLCFRLYRQGRTDFSPSDESGLLPRQKEKREAFVELCQVLGLITPQDTSYTMDPSLRCLGTALFFAAEGSFDQLTETLQNAPPDPEPLLFLLAELAPCHPIPESSQKDLLPDEAWAFLHHFSLSHSLLQRLVVFYSQGPGLWRIGLRPSLSLAWAYERGGDLSGCDLRGLPVSFLCLPAARLLGPEGPARLPRNPRLENVAVLPLPPRLCWMDWRDDILLLAGETRAVVFDERNRMVSLALPQDCRRIMRAALCPDTGQVQIFYSPKRAEIFAVCLDFDLRTGAPLPEQRTRFSLERMDELRSCQLSETEWLTSDKRNRLRLCRMLGRTFLVLAPRFSPQEGRPLWEVLPYDTPLPVPLQACGDLRLEERDNRFLLYDIRQGPLWTEKRSRLWEILRNARGPGNYAQLQEGTPAPLPDGFLMEFQVGMGLELIRPGYEQEYWIIACDARGNVRSPVRYNMNKFRLLESERWPQDTPYEEKKAFEEAERSPAAVLNHRVYANGKLYMRSDLKPYLVIIWDIRNRRVEQMVTASSQIEAVVQDGDRVIAVCAGHREGFLLSGTVEEMRRTLPLNRLLKACTRYIPHPGNALVPCVLSPLLLEQARALVPDPEPDAPLQPETLLHPCPDTETLFL